MCGSILRGLTLLLVRALIDYFLIVFFLTGVELSVRETAFEGL